MTSGRGASVLILSADTGAGHRRAGETIAVAIADEIPRTDKFMQSNPRVVDALREYGGFPLRYSNLIYRLLVKYCPKAYGAIFRLTDSRVGFTTARWLFGQPLRRGLRRLFRECRPQLIVSVHPMLNHLAVQALRDIKLNTPVCTVVTDLTNIHFGWFAPGVSACITPTAEVRSQAVASGLPESAVYCLGLPISPAFPKAEDQIDRELARNQLGLDATRPTFLLVAGGEGMGSVADWVSTACGLNRDVQIIAIAGHNRGLRGKLESIKQSSGATIRVLGYTDNMPQLMVASDVVVTKAGPGTIAEAVSCKVPIVLAYAVPGQETGNIRFVLDNGIGVFAGSQAELSAVLTELLNPSSTLLAAMKDDLTRMASLNGTSAIVSLLSEVLHEKTCHLVDQPG